MPLPARNSRRRKKNPDNEERAAGDRPPDEVTAPTRMKLRVRRGDGAVASGGGGSVEGTTERNREGSRSSSRRKNSNKNSGSGTAASASSSSPPTTSTSLARLVMAAEEASPDSKCPICLDRFNNLAYLDHCLHRFCFPCIQEWSHNKAECPLCKQPFASILHSVRAEDDFKEYTLQPPPTNNSVAATVAMVAAMASAARSDHHMRLMLRRHRVAEGRETTTRRRRRERGARGRGSEERAGGVWELYLEPPPLPFPPLPRHLTVSNVVAEDSEEAEELPAERARGGANPTDHRAIFNQLTGLRGAPASLASNGRVLRRLMTRLSTRQRQQREGGTVKRLREGQMLDFRRMLYRCAIRVRGVAGVSGNLGQQRDITAESFHQSPTHLNRLRPWLRRELRVMYGSNSSLVDIVQNIIMARLALHGLENTLNLEEDLQPFLQARTEHFLHELVSFARSPLSMDSYDVQAVYEPPTVTAMELDGLSSSSGGSSVIAISEEEEEERRGRSEGSAINDLNDIIQTGSSLSLSGWDDETPGPSYSTAEPSCSLAPTLPLSPAPQKPAAERGGDRPEEEVEECLIVGYKKPIAERTPELVQLSSDTDEDKGEKKREEVEPSEKAPPLPSPTPSSSYLPVIPPSTSSAFTAEQEDGQKDDEVWRRRSRSWSGSSDRSRKSVCSLSLVPPERQHQEDGQHGRRRKKKKRRGRDDTLKRSGTFGNPNRSMYPPMMQRRSPPLFDSSSNSCSPLPSSPDFHCVQVSPLSSPVSSPSCSSPSPPLCLSPQQTPPSPSRSPAEHAHRAEKPGGKRKYKSRHLNSITRDPTWRQNGGPQREKRKERRKRREKPRKEDHQENGALGEESRKRSRQDRSPSVEIIYEGTISSSTTQPLGHKPRRKRHRRARHSSPPVIITLDSDGSDDDVNKKLHSASSSPLSSQQTIDFSDLPPLPLVHSAGVGGALDTEIGELPAEILDRGSDGSEVETAGPSAGRINISDNSDVDVENVEDDVSPLQNNKQSDAHGSVPAADEKTSAEDHQNRGQVPQEHREVSPSDKYLLSAILSDLNRISEAKQELFQNLKSGFSSGSRTKTPQEGCLDEMKPDWTSSPQNLGFDFQSSSSSAPSLPPLDVPPLLRRASPVRSYNRNTPPPLKHKDAGSPQRTAMFPRDLPSHCSSDADPAAVPSRQTVPSIETLQGHLRQVSAMNSTEQIPSTSCRTPDFTPPPSDSHHSSEPSDPAHKDSVCRGDGVKTTSPACWVAPVDLHPPSGSAAAVFSGVDSNNAACSETRRPPPAGVPPEGPTDFLSLIPASGGQLDRRTADGRLNHAAFSSSPLQHSASLQPPKSCSKHPHPSDSAPQPPAHDFYLNRDAQILEELQTLFGSADSNKV